LILLDQQDRSLWNRDQIAEGSSFTENALASRRFGTERRSRFHIQRRNDPDLGTARL
jgi:predicted RNA polymerase sigma factor